MANKLTLNQEQVYLFIREYIAVNKCSPYIRQIQQSCNIRSHKSVIDRLNSIERKGYIHRKINQHKGIRLLKNKRESI
ncbi:MAG: hypothetical protein KKH29_03105 [Candidatus Omnitrophica bacterium]|nr:hypothetical protein [Candidatus Omnitrophota bacterium]